MSGKRKTIEAEHVRKIDVERMRKQAAELGAIAQEQATLAAKQATLAGQHAAHLAEQGKEWATPHVEAAAAWAGPKVDKAWRETVKATAPKVEHATEAVRPVVDNAYERIVDDYLPRVQKAMHDAADAAAAANGKAAAKATKGAKAAAKATKSGAKAAAATKAGKAARKALAEEPKKGHALGRTLGWVLVGTAAAGTGYLLWRRSQPVDDPWAEEYWEDTTVTSPATSTEPGPAGKAGAADKAKAAASGAATTAKEKAGEIKDKLAKAKDSSTGTPGQTWESDQAKPGQEHRAEGEGPSGTPAT